MHGRCVMVCIGLCLIFVLSPINAQQVLFEDNFDTENDGIGELSYDNLANWTILSGGIDLIGNGFWDAYPGNGLYLDLDGTYGSDRSQAKAGTIQTKEDFEKPNQWLSLYTIITIFNFHENPNRLFHHARI